MKRSSSVTTVNRLVEVLDSFCQDQPVWSLAHLSVKLNLPKSTLHRFLTGLEVHGILRRDPDDKLWRLGYRLVQWGRLAEKSTGLAELAEPFLRNIAAATGETVALTVYAEQEVVCIAKVDTQHSVRLALDVGERRPAHAGASSKVLMAFLSPDEIDTIINNQGLPRLCSGTVTEPDVLRAELDTIREQGYALSVEETDPGAWGIATPIFGHKDQVVAAIGVIGPSLRFSAELAQRYVAVCQEAARDISRLVGAHIQD